MIQYKLNSFSNADFHLAVDRSIHTADFPIHSHNFTELTVVTGGTATHIVEGTTHPMQRGTVMSVSPNFSHEYIEVNSLLHYNFMFDIDKLSLLESELKKLKGFQAFFVTLPEHKYRHKFISAMMLNDEQMSFTESLCELIYSEFNKKGNGYKIRVKTYFLTLIAYLSSLYDPSEEKSSKELLKIVDTVTYIEENYADKISVPYLAKQTYLSERQYLRIFKSVYGMTPTQYILNCRLNHACDLILNSSFSLTEIASECGFSDKSSFSRLFRRQFGITPSDYRKQAL